MSEPPMIEALSEAERAEAIDGLPDWDYDEARDAIERVHRRVERHERIAVLQRRPVDPGIVEDRLQRQPARRAIVAQLTQNRGTNSGRRAWNAGCPKPKSVCSADTAWPPLDSRKSDAPACGPAGQREPRSLSRAKQRQ